MTAPRVIALLSVALSAMAIRAQAIEVTLASVPERVAQANPDLAAARFMIDEARARHLGAGRLMNPELEFSIRRMTEGREGEFDIGLMQRFPLTARLRIEKAVSAAQIAAAVAEVADKQRMLVAEAQSMAVNILAMRAQIAIAENQATLADTVAEIALARAGAGESSIEAAQLQLEARRARSGILRMRASIAGMTESLKPMLGLSPPEPLEIAGALPPARMPAFVQPGDGRPDLQAAVHRVESAERSVDLSRARRWEDIGAGIMVDQARVMDLPADLETETMVGVRLSVPLPLWNRNQGEIAETTAARARAVAELEALRLKAQAEASSARKVMERLLPVLDESTGHLAPMAQQQIKLVRDGYSNNRASVQDVLRARDQLLMVEMSAIDALRDFHLARVRWMAATENRSASQK
jgi:outer membrane protein, heavy metal efflux system